MLNVNATTVKLKYLLYPLLAGLFFSLNSQSQTNYYHSYFGEKFTHWYSYREFIDLAYSEMYSVNTRDTLLSNGVRYKILSPINYGGLVNDYYYFGIREEVETGSLFVNTDGVSEVLVSKMDMEIGDKFYFPPPTNVEYNPSTPYSMYFFEGLHTDEKGIGPNISFGPFLDYGYWSFNVCFICYENENEFWKYIDFYKNPEYMEGHDCLFNYMSYQGIKADFGKSNDYSKKYGLSDFNAHKLTKERNGQYAIYLTNDKESRLRLAFKRGGRDEKGREVIEIVDITDHYREEGNKFRSDIESDVWDFSKIFSNRGINLDEIGIKGDWD